MLGSLAGFESHVEGVAAELDRMPLKGLNLDHVEARCEELSRDLHQEMCWPRLDPFCSRVETPPIDADNPRDSRRLLIIAVVEFEIKPDLSRIAEGTC